MLRRSAPPSSRWVANVCRRACGERCAMPARSSARRSALRTSDGCSGRPRTLTNRRPPVPGRGHLRPAAGEVALERCLGGAAERHDALLPALAGHAQRAGLEADVGEREVARLGGAQAAAVEELEQRAVAQVARLGAGRRVEQARDLVGRERRRQRARAARPGHERGRAALDRAAVMHPRVGAADGAQLAGGRGRRIPAGAQVGGVAAQRARVGRARLDVGGGEPAVELVEVGRVGAQGRRRRTASAHPVEIRVEHPAARRGRCEDVPPASCRKRL